MAVASLLQDKPKILFYAAMMWVQNFGFFLMYFMMYRSIPDPAGVMWIVHLLVALPYCLCTVTIPLAIYSDDGKTCREGAGAPLYPLVPVYWTHCGLFFVYVWMMLSITYFSFLKPTLFAKDTDTAYSQE